MPNIFLLCSEEDAQVVAPYAGTIGFHLREATAVALGLNGPEEVAFRIVPFVAGDNAGRFEISAVASQKLERLVSLLEWRDALAKAWYDLSLESRMSEIADILRGEVEVWPQLPIGWWGIYKQGKLLRD